MICPDQCLVFSRELSDQAFLAGAVRRTTLLAQAERWLDVAMCAEIGDAEAIVRILERIIACDVGPNPR